MPDTTVAPYKAIVRITVQIGTSLYQGSGVMISPDEVLTASHMVWTTGVGTATNIKVMPGYSNGVAPFGTYSGTVAHYNAINDSGGVLSLPDIANDYAIIHLSTPTTVGTMSLGSDFSGGAVTVSGYPSTSAAQVDQAETLTTGQYNELTGPALGAGSSGGPAWTTDVGGGAGTVVGLVSAESLTGTGYFPKITAAIRTQLLTWVAADDGVNTVASYVDTKTQQSGTVAMTATTTGPSYLQWQYIWSSADNVSIATGVPNSFLHGGAGDDALAVSSGQNVLDGGAGSNFLVGGSGTGHVLHGFTGYRGGVEHDGEFPHRGLRDALGVHPRGFQLHLGSDAGRSRGATGATLRANIIGGAGRTGNGIDASITFTGMSVAQAKSMITTVSTAGSAAPYLLIYNQGVLMSSLEGRVAIVTGPGGGIGAAIAAAFAKEGAKVACVDLAPPDAVVAGIVAAGGTAMGLAADVSREADTLAAVAATIRAWGGVDVLVNGAAPDDPTGTIVELAPAAWDKVFAVHVTGAYLMSRAALPHMISAGVGNIIHIASQMGRVGSPGRPAYCAAKGALIQLAKVMALDHAAQGIRVNALSPGAVETGRMLFRHGTMEAARAASVPKHPIGRLGQPEEIAQAALFLASDASSFMTGADLLVDGGYTAV